MLCVVVSTHGKEFFAVRQRTAHYVCTAPHVFPVVVAETGRK
jgi:hypothetical protein